MAAGQSSLTNKEIETSVSELSFTVTGPHGGATTARAILEAVMGATVISLQKQDTNNTTTMIQRLNVADLAEISAHNKGVVNIIVTGANAEIGFSVEVAHDSAVPLNDEAKFMYSVDGLPAGTSCTIDAIDHGNVALHHINYDNKFANANVAKDYDIEAAYGLALPVDKVTEVELLFENGRRVKLSKREIKRVLIDSQDVVFCLDGKVQFGHGKWAVLSVEQVSSARVTLSESTNFYLLRNQSL